MTREDFINDAEVAEKLDAYDAGIKTILATMELAEKLDAYDAGIKTILATMELAEKYEHEE